jgi:hypothetical protein
MKTVKSYISNNKAALVYIGESMAILFGVLGVFYISFYSFLFEIVNKF